MKSIIWLREIYEIFQVNDCKYITENIIYIIYIDTHILAWRIPWTEEPGRLQSMGSQRAKHD